MHEYIQIEKTRERDYRKKEIENECNIQALQLPFSMAHQILGQRKWICCSYCCSVLLSFFFCAAKLNYSVIIQSFRLKVLFTFWFEVSYFKCVCIWWRWAHVYAHARSIAQSLMWWFQSKLYTFQIFQFEVFGNILCFFIPLLPFLLPHSSIHSHNSQ